MESIRNKVNSDGTVNIYCTLCGSKIDARVYMGYSTAVCYYCSTDTPRPVEDTLNLPVYNPAAPEKFGLLNSVRKALGFKKKRQPTLTESKQTAIRKKRKPLFAIEEEDDTNNE